MNRFYSKQNIFMFSPKNKICRHHNLLSAYIMCAQREALRAENLELNLMRGFHNTVPGSWLT